MRRLFLLLAVILALLIPVESFASPFMVLPKRGSAWSGSGYSAETLAYQTRVEADGGLVVSMADVEAAYKFLSDNTLTATAWWSPQFGVKTGGTTLLSSQSITCNLSLAEGYAFISNPSVDLTPYVGTAIKITDSAGKSVYGWIKAAGTGETYGDELVSNGGFDSDTLGWGETNCTIASVSGGQSGNCLEITRTGGDSQVSYRQMTIGTDVLLSVSAYSKSGSSGNETSKIRILKADTLTLVKETSQASSASWEAFDPFYVALSEANPYVFLAKDSSTEGTMLFDTVSAKQVLTPSSTGVKIVSTSGGSTYNWASEDSGFNRNDTSYTIAPLVTKLYDLSSNDNDLSQATAGKMPAWLPNRQNAKSAINWDGLERYLQLSLGSALTQPNTFFSVVKNTGALGTSRMIIDGGAAGRNILALPTGTNTWSIYSGSSWVGSSDDTRDATILISALFSGASSVIWKNGSSVGTGNPGTNSLSAIIIGDGYAAQEAANGDFIGDMYDLMLFNSDQSANRTTIESFLNTKWAVWE